MAEKVSKQLLFTYRERKIAKDIGEYKLDELVNLIRLDFGIINGENIIFQKFDDSWSAWVDVTSEQEFQNRDKIKVLVQAGSTSTGKAKGNTENSLPDTHSTNETCTDVDLGYLPHGEKHRDTCFSNNLLQRFYPLVKTFMPSKTFFRKNFIEERCRQWKIYKKKEKIEKSYQFLKSDNMASIGNRLDKGYIPTPNDGTVLSAVAIKLDSLLKEIVTLIDEIKMHDQSLFETNGLCLKRKWKQFHHTCNEEFITSLMQLKSEVNELLSRVQETSTKFSTVCRKRSSHGKSCAAKKRKNNRKNEKRKFLKRT
ncbi:Hypothetical predicted protein [Paramuricea clavata]|uniref:Uncharacterized protein n=1 Tax=Paramuricea clavata TaxID=317549 RepID=A0A7D9I737_PARCT|nr:Hypothetical predicted protein [Paramuricea clavata]